MSLPFLFFDIFVNSCAICWWCPHLSGSLSVLQMKSGQTFFTKYKKLSWHNFICFNHTFSSLSRNWSVVNNSVSVILIYYTLGSPLNLPPNSRKPYYFYLSYQVKVKLVNSRKKNPKKIKNKIFNFWILVGTSIGGSHMPTPWAYVLRSYLIFLFPR